MILSISFSFSQGRNSVVSRAMRVVDNDTRREVRLKRLLSLEADNYNEEVGGGGGDDAYDDNSSEEDGVDDGEVKKSKKRSSSTAGSSSGGIKRKGSGLATSGFSLQGVKDKWASRRPRSLDKILDEYQQSNAPVQVDADGTNAMEVNIITAMVRPSRLPTRHFCSVCGYQGKYACIRCGMRCVV